MREMVKRLMAVLWFLAAGYGALILVGLGIVMPIQGGTGGFAGNFPPALGIALVSTGIGSVVHFVGTGKWTPFQKDKEIKDD